MKHSARLIASVAIVSFLASTAPLKAQEGDGYQQSRSLKLRPEWALAGLVVVAITAVILQNSTGGHVH